jgi:hypothetical protein
MFSEEYGTSIFRVEVGRGIGCLYPDFVEGMKQKPIVRVLTTQKTTIQKLLL